MINKSNLTGNWFVDRCPESAAKHQELGIQACLYLGKQPGYLELITVYSGNDGAVSVVAWCNQRYLDDGTFTEAVDDDVRLGLVDLLREEHNYPYVHSLCRMIASMLATIRPDAIVLGGTYLANAPKLRRTIAKRFDRLLDVALETYNEDPNCCGLVSYGHCDTKMIVIRGL